MPKDDQTAAENVRMEEFQGQSGVALAEMIARRFHEGQVDKVGVPYIDHVASVANSPFVTTSEQRQAAWLHDVVEDTSATLDLLRALGVSEPVVLAVDRLTHRPSQPRREYIERILGCPIATAAKKGDNRHNRSRIGNLPDAATQARLQDKYDTEWIWLTEGLPPHTATHP